jgi:hypothetical protein
MTDTRPSLCRRHRLPPEIIGAAVWLLIEPKIELYKRGLTELAMGPLRGFLEGLALEGGGQNCRLNGCLST